MQIHGEWLVCDDGVVRPVLRGEVLATNGAWVPVPFLLDTGADRTVFSGAILAAMSPHALAASERLSGLGGTVRTVSIATRVRFSHEESRKVAFRGSYAAITDLEALDMSVLGRDITNMFAVVVDRPGNVVCLLGQRHQYMIVQRCWGKGNTLFTVPVPKAQRVWFRQSDKNKTICCSTMHSETITGRITPG